MQAAMPELMAFSLNAYLDRAVDLFGEEGPSVNDTDMQQQVNNTVAITGFTA
jgi:hypothetical protein